MQAAEYLGIHASNPGRSFLQSIAVGIFTNGQQDFSNGGLNSLLIDNSSFRW
jgi:hypothetical protein